MAGGVYFGDERDDGIHVPSEDPRWRESFYFSFFDARHRVGGFSSIGKKPNKGYSGSINCVWGPEIPTYVSLEYGKVNGHDDQYEVEGLRYRRREGFGEWEADFAGLMNNGGRGVDCAESAVAPARKDRNKGVGISYSLRFVPEYAACFYAPDERWFGLFDGHIDEVGWIHGELLIGGKEYEIEGRAAKDHSWGVRDWFEIGSWRWIDMLGAKEPHMSLWRARGVDDGEWAQDGALYQKGEAGAIESYWERVRGGSESGPPEAIELVVGGGGAVVRGQGKIRRRLPLRFRRKGPGPRSSALIQRTLVSLDAEAGDEEAMWGNVEFQAID